MVSDALVRLPFGYSLVSDRRVLPRRIIRHEADRDKETAARVASTTVIFSTVGLTLGGLPGWLAGQAAGFMVGLARDFQIREAESRR